MSRGELLTRFSIWVTLAGWFIGRAASALSRRKPGLQSFSRWAWTIACLSLLVHVAFAYHFYHGWSQDSAYRETARQTAEVTGLNWGGGLYFNYGLMALWVADVGWWWRGLEAHRLRPLTVSVIWHAFVFFMIFNATVVFGRGALRVVGLVLCLGLCLLWSYTAAVKGKSSKSIKGIG
jgi:hypothetical protein